MPNSRARMSVEDFHFRSDDDENGWWTHNNGQWPVLCGVEYSRMLEVRVKRFAKSFHFNLTVCVGWSLVFLIFINHPTGFSRMRRSLADDVDDDARCKCLVVSRTYWIRHDSSRLCVELTIIRWVSCCGVSYYEIEGSLVAHTSAWFINAHKKNSFSCKSSNISHFSTILETLSEGIWNSLSSSSTAIKTQNEMLRSAVRLQMGVEREWEVASNMTWTYVRFHWDLLALSRSAEGSTIHFFSHVDWAAVGYKKSNNNRLRDRVSAHSEEMENSITIRKWACELRWSKR